MIRVFSFFDFKLIYFKPKIKISLRFNKNVFNFSGIEDFSQIDAKSILLSYKILIKSDNFYSHSPL